MPGQSKDINSTGEQEDRVPRSILPIPDRAYQGLITYDAKDPDSKFPPIALGQHAQRDHRSLAALHQGKGRDSFTVPPCH